MQDSKDKVKKSLKYSILDGAFYSSMVGFGESFFSAFAIFLKANNVQLGLLGSLPQAVGSLSQIYSHKIVSLFGSRKRVICTAVLLEALMYLPIAVVFFLGELKVYYLLLFLCMYWLFETTALPAWSSWMGDIVDEKERGRYFGRRSQISGLVSFVSFVAGGYLLQRFSGDETTQYVGFAIIFLLAMLSRFMSFFYLAKMYEPRYEPVDGSHFSFVDFLKQARFRNYGTFVIYLCFMNFAVFLSAPFFAAYMLYDLHFSYATFTVVSATALITKYISMPIWGMVSDKYGTKKILALSGFLMPILPLLWVFSAEIPYLLLVQVYSGFVWAGFEIASFNFIFDTTTPAKRVTCVSYYNVLKGASIFIGALLGGLIVRHNSFFWSQYYLVFILSFILRYAASFLFLPKLKEARTVESIPYHKLVLEAITTMPTTGIIYDAVTFGIKHAPFNKNKRNKG